MLRCLPDANDLGKVATVAIVAIYFIQPENFCRVRSNCAYIARLFLHSFKLYVKFCVTEAQLLSILGLRELREGSARIRPCKE